MRVAYFSPLPPERSGVADYSALLLPALSKRIDVQVMRRGARRAPRHADVAVYQVGNHVDAHGWIVKALYRSPGVVVLHEYVLHHLIAALTLGRGNGSGYLEAMQREEGTVGRLLGHAVIDGLIPPLWETRPHDFPLAAAVLDQATGIIVHSHYVKRRVREAGFEGRIWRIPHPAWPSSVASPDPAILSHRAPVIACLGNLNPSKRLPQLLQAFARLRRTAPDALLVLAGEVAPDVKLNVWMERLGLRSGMDVLELGYVEEDRLWSVLARCDICVSLRWPTMGETSGSAIRALTAGRPLIVTDVGWFSELPDTTVVKVPADESEPEALAAELNRLVTDSGLRARMGAAGLEYVRREHDLDRVTELYVAALEEAAGGQAVEAAMLGEIAGAAVDVGIGQAAPELTEMVTRLRELTDGD